MAVMGEGGSVSYTSTTRPSRTAFERRCTRLESFHERREARRAVAFGLLCEDAREIVRWGVEQGLLTYPETEDNNQDKETK